MNKNKWKRAVSLFMAGAMALSVTACGGGGSASSDGGKDGQGGASGTAVSTTIDKNVIFKETPIDLSAVPFKAEDINEAVLAGDRLYMSGYSYDDETKTSGRFVVSMNTEGSDVKGFVLEEVSDGSFDYSQPAFDEEGNIYAVKTDYGTPPPNYDEEAVPYEEAMPAEGSKEGGNEEDTAESDAKDQAEGDASDNATATGETSTEAEASTDTEESTVGEDEYEDYWNNAKYYLTKFDKDGALLFQTELKKEDFIKEDGWFGIYNIRFVKDAGVLLQMETGLFLCSAEDGTLTRQVYESNQEYYAEFLYSGKGQMYVISWDGEPALKEIDLETGKEGAQITIPSVILSNGFGSDVLQPGTNCDFLVQDRDGISTWNIGEDTTKRIMSLTDSDIAVENLNSIIQMSDTRFFVTYSTTNLDGEYTTVSAFFDKVNPEDVVDKKVLTIGLNYMDNRLRSIIVNFNKTNEKYRVKVVDYSQYNTDDDWMAGSNKLNADLVSGNAPDMLYLDMGQSLQSLEAKGVFEPLDDYLANDPEISQKEYITKVLDVYKYKDTTYMMVPTFVAFTYAMKKSVADTLTDWNLQTLDQLIQDKGLEYTTAFGYPMPNTQFLQMCLVFDSNSYMDWNAGQAKFNTPQFIELLNFCKKLPENVDDLYGEDTWQQYETAFRDDKALLYQASITRFQDYSQLKYATFGEDVAFVGFPRMEGAGGAAVSANYMIGMNSHASDKDACWEFMRTFYLDDFQNSVVKEGWQLPIAKAQMDELAKKSMEKPYHMIDGQKEEYDETYYIGGEEIKIPPMTQEDVDLLYEYFDNIDTAISYDEKVFNIITEEAAPFFSGQKTAEECAQVIQSKVQLYMDENS